MNLIIDMWTLVDSIILTKLCGSHPHFIIKLSYGCLFRPQNELLKRQ